MVAADGGRNDLRRRPIQGHIAEEMQNGGDPLYSFDFDALCVKTKPNWLKRWNHVIIGMLWTFYHYYMTYSLVMEWHETESFMGFLSHCYIRLGMVTLYWAFLSISVYSVFLYDQCVRFHVKNFDKFPKMYSDHANQAALMHEDLKNYRFSLQLFGALFLSPMRMFGGVLFFSFAFTWIGIPLSVLNGRFKMLSRRYAAFLFHYLILFGFWCVGICEVKTVYAEGVPRGKPMNVISNHIGILDVLYMLHSGMFSFVAKKQLEEAFIIGHFIRLLNCIIVDRDSAQNRKEVFWSIVNRMQSIEQGKEELSLMVYPEGTTSRGNILLPFKHGAFGALVPLQPMLVVLKYSYVNITFDAFHWMWWAIHAFTSPVSIPLVAYWLPTIHPPTKEEIALKGEQTCIRYDQVEPQR
ncbi:acyltransferase domain-containing protein [Babesia ovis]|uniref:Acyltransferase domain-containing protein n=1 Tax=Babesia ovis TaxID=5869 RepID=A0A9W5TEH2_BABOV|nr:acyltransferase domain-containing protein [Babesia ovis]